MQLQVMQYQLTSATIRFSIIVCVTLQFTPSPTLLLVLLLVLGLAKLLLFWY